MAFSIYDLNSLGAEAVASYDKWSLENADKSLDDFFKTQEGSVYYQGLLEKIDTEIKNQEIDFANDGEDETIKKEMDAMASLQFTDEKGQPDNSVSELFYKAAQDATYMDCVDDGNVNDYKKHLANNVQFFSDNLICSQIIFETLQDTENLKQLVGDEKNTQAYINNGQLDIEAVLRNKELVEKFQREYSEKIYDAIGDIRSGKSHMTISPEVSAAVLAIHNNNLKQRAEAKGVKQLLNRIKDLDKKTTEKFPKTYPIAKSLITTTGVSITAGPIGLALLSGYRTYKNIKKVKEEAHQKGQTLGEYLKNNKAEAAKIGFAALGTAISAGIGVDAGLAGNFGMLHHGAQAFKTQLGMRVGRAATALGTGLATSYQQLKQKNYKGAVKTTLMTAGFAFGGLVLGEHAGEWLNKFKPETSPSLEDVTNVEQPVITPNVDEVDQNTALSDNVTEVDQNTMLSDNANEVNSHPVLSDNVAETRQTEVVDDITNEETSTPEISPQEEIDESMVAQDLNGEEETLVSEEVPEGYTRNVSIDENNNTSELNRFDTDAGTMETLDVTDPNGQLLEHQEISYSRDANGNEVKFTQFHDENYAPDNETLSCQGSLEEVFDRDSGNIIFSERLDANGDLIKQSEFRYNEAGLLTDEKTTFANGLSSNTSYTYNEVGECTNQIVTEFDENGVAQGHYDVDKLNNDTWQYFDQENNLIKEGQGELSVNSEAVESEPVMAEQITNDNEMNNSENNSTVTETIVENTQETTASQSSSSASELNNSTTQSVHEDVAASSSTPAVDETTASTDAVADSEAQVVADNLSQPAPSDENSVINGTTGVAVGAIALGTTIATTTLHKTDSESNDKKGQENETPVSDATNNTTNDQSSKNNSTINKLRGIGGKKTFSQKLHNEANKPGGGKHKVKPNNRSQSTGR